MLVMFLGMPALTAPRRALQIISPMGCNEPNVTICFIICYIRTLIMQACCRDGTFVEQAHKCSCPSAPRSRCACRCWHEFLMCWRCLPTDRLSSSELGDPETLSVSYALATEIQAPAPCAAEERDATQRKGIPRRGKGFHAEGEPEYLAPKSLRARQRTKGSDHTFLKLEAFCCCNSEHLYPAKAAGGQQAGVSVRVPLLQQPCAHRSSNQTF